MTLFEYLTVIVSLILGLGIAHLLSGMARLIQARHRVRLYWVPLVWVFLLFVQTVQIWWSNWEWHYYEDWNFFSFMFVLLLPIVLYLLAAIVLPDFEPYEDVDLREYYYRRRGWLFGIGTLLPFLPLVEDLIFHSRPLFCGPNYFRMAFMGLIASAAFSSKHWYHAALTGLIGGLFFVFLFLYSMGLR